MASVMCHGRETLPTSPNPWKARGLLPTRPTRSRAVAVPAGFKAVGDDRSPGRFAFAAAWRAVGFLWSIRTENVGTSATVTGSSLDSVGLPTASDEWSPTGTRIPAQGCDLPSRWAAKPA